jgi:hypothetical protein
VLLLLLLHGGALAKIWIGFQERTGWRRRRREMEEREEADEH